jgi:hypothetical protein
MYGSHSKATRFLYAGYTFEQKSEWMQRRKELQDGHTMRKKNANTR